MLIPARNTPEGASMLRFDAGISPISGLNDMLRLLRAA